MARCIVRKQATFTRALSSKGRDCGTPAAIVLLRYMGISDVRINVRINVGINVKKTKEPAQYRVTPESKSVKRGYYSSIKMFVSMMLRLNSKRHQKITIRRREDMFRVPRCKI